METSALEALMDALEPLDPPPPLESSLRYKYLEARLIPSIQQ